MAKRILKAPVLWLVGGAAADFRLCASRAALSNAAKSGAVLLSNQRIPPHCDSLRQTGENFHGFRSYCLRFRRV